MARPGNRATIPQGMLAPSGYVEPYINPSVQATSRPHGTLLHPSPGYQTIRPGKNRFQGKGPTGGFRPMTYAEDVGGTGAALAVIPGDTSEIDASSFIPSGGSIAEGTVIISDRGSENHGYATVLHEGWNTLADMGDRDPNRPRTRSQWLRDPVGMFRTDFHRSPAMTVAGAAVALWLFNAVVRDLESNLGRYRGRGLGTTATSVPAAGAQTAGDVSANAANEIGQAADKAVNEIKTVTDEAVSSIKDAANEAKSAV